LTTGYGSSFSFSPLPTHIPAAAMTTNMTLIIPMLAVGYLMIVYVVLSFAQRSKRASRPEG
jgi:hypothetical protein